MFFLDKLLIFLIIYFILKLAEKLITNFSYNLSKTVVQDKINYGIVSKVDLGKITNSKFIIWCENLIQKAFKYSNLHITSFSHESIINMTAIKNDERVYISVLQCRYKENEDELEEGFMEIDCTKIKELVGTMEHDNVRNAIIITNNSFSKEAISYVNSLPVDYQIKLMDSSKIFSLSNKRGAEVGHF